MTRNIKATNAGSVSAKRRKAKPAAPAVPPRKKDPVALKEQKAAATREAVVAIQACSGRSAIEIEELMKIGRQKQSKRDGKSGEMLNSYLNADTESDTAANSTLARLMFSAVECGLLNPQEFMTMSARPGIRRAILPVRSLLLQLAIRGELSAPKEETDRGYKEWCEALAAKSKACKNERAQFVDWKQKVCKGLDDFADRLASMKLHALSLTMPNAAAEFDSRTADEPVDALFHQVYELVTVISTIQAHPLLAFDGHAPDSDDSAKEKAQLSKWKQKASRTLVEFVDRLAFMKQHAWSQTLQSTTADIEVEGKGSGDSCAVLFRYFNNMKATLEAVQVDPLHEVDSDLPDVNDSPEEQAEALRQLAQHLDRPPVSAEEWEGYRAAIKAEQKVINANAPEVMRERFGDLPLYLAEMTWLDDGVAKPVVEPLPGVFTVTEVLEWQARQEAAPEHATVLIKP